VQPSSSSYPKSVVIAAQRASPTVAWAPTCVSSIDVNCKLGRKGASTFSLPPSLSRPPVSGELVERVGAKGRQRVGSRRLAVIAQRALGVTARDRVDPWQLVLHGLT
jgi:hypothetical protein